MTSYKAPAFQDRLALAAQAKQKALEKLKAKPPVDPAVLAERRAAAEKREAAEAEKRAAKLAAREQEKAEKIAAREAARPVVVPPKERSLPTAAEMKAARDARYAARKARK
jgi:hypothetical protein